MPVRCETALTLAVFGRIFRRGSPCMSDAMVRHSAKHVLSLALVLATAFAGTLPNVGVREASNSGCQSQRCCGACSSSEAAASTCCSAVQRPSVCHCNAENRRSALPPERRISPDQISVYRTERAVSFGLGVCRSRVSEDAAISWRLPTSRWQAVLCHWLI